MEQIVLTIDQLRPGMPANGLACYLKELHDIQVMCAYLNKTIGDKKEELTSNGLRKDTQMYFERRGIDTHYINADSDAKLQALSGCADVIVLDADLSFDGKEIARPSKTLKHILRHTNCPIFIAPQIFEGITSLIYCHDGTTAGFYALKQLAYLFPSLGKIPITVFTLGSRPELYEMNMLKEWLHAHYPLARIKSAGGPEKKYFFEALQQNDDVLLIMGAYSRSLFSQWLRRSHADFFIRFFNATIFIAHP